MGKIVWNAIKSRAISTDKRWRTHEDTGNEPFFPEILCYVATNEETNWATRTN